ncbi:DUF6114 domain-containing protein [Streptomyces sp. bgisy027]|uniref:DUF6114 domain-containing protein n=1 Tax=unclassified Streptomyces TaxID=2593676 RepID=UPI003D736033
MSAETPAAPGHDEHYLRVYRRNFRAWRGTRPFWAGLFVMLGGLPIAYFPYANLQIGHLTLAMQTAGGSSSLIIGVLLVVLGFTLWFQKHVRTFAGIAAILLALVSIPLSNLGGFLIGFLFALVGGAMAVAWVPGGDADATPAKTDTTGEGGAPEGAADPDPDTAILKPVVGEPNDLSGTSPANGANGRHSAG